jgi:FixJ family two-component response regulator
MTDQTMTVFVVDDDAAVRDSLSLLIEQEGLAVKTFASARAFLEDFEPEHTGCVIVDLRMPEMDGMALQEEMARRGILLPVIFLTAHGDIPTSVRAIKAGAVDFLTKPITRSTLMASINSACEEGDRLRAQADTRVSAATLLASLTERERDVLTLAIEGLPNKVIARQLDISHRTVEIHKARIMSKTGATTLLELARIAEAAGFRGPSGGNSS